MSGLRATYVSHATYGPLHIEATGFHVIGSGRPLDEINHVGCGMSGKRMMGKARPRRDVTGHFARKFELLIRVRNEQ